MTVNDLPEAWITLFHVLNGCAFIPFAAATWVAWYPKAPKPLAAFFVTGVLIDGFLRHVIPLLPAAVLPTIAHETALAAQSCIDACSVVFLVTFVTALFIDTTTNLALAAFGFAVVSVITDMFSPDDAIRVRDARPLCQSCMPTDPPPNASAPLKCRW